MTLDQRGETEMSRLENRDMKDAALLRAVLASDAGAWREFVRRFDKAMRRCVRGVAGRYRNVRSSDDIDEVMGEVYLGLVADDMQRLRAFDETRGRRLSSWVGLLSIKMAHDYYRGLRRVPQFAGLDEAADVADPAADALENLMDDQNRHLVEELLDRLPANDRAFMERCLDEDADFETLAGELGVAPASVRGRRARITTRLRSDLMKGSAA